MKDDLDKTSTDVIYSSLKAALTVIPVVGSAIAEIQSLLIQSPLEKRRDNFIRNLAERINEIDKKVVDLINNEEFISILLKSINIVLKNHEQEKLDILKNAVINSIDTELTFSEQEIFLNLIEDMTIWHIKILNFLSNPHKQLEKIGHKVVIDSIGQITVDSMRLNKRIDGIKYCYSELKGKDDFIRAIVKDLVNKNLINEHNLDDINGQLIPVVNNNYCNKFLQYISS